MKNPFVSLRAGLAALAIAAVTAAGAAAPASGADPDDPAWPAEWAQRLVHVQDVWQATTGDPSIVIATVDTGADELPDLEGAFVQGWDFVGNDGVTADEHGHGTQVASVIGARGGNGAGMAGYCWRCRIMPVRVSADGTALGERIAQGIRWAVDHGARIVNVSLNAPGPPEWAEADAVAYAVDHGVLLIASAGNAGSADLRYPASFPGVLAVAASDETDHLYPWSTRGPWVQLAAPGCEVVLDPVVGAGTICGTSFTPAAVAGIAGLLLSLQPSLTAARVAAALEKTAVPVQGVTAGRVDAAAAMRWLGLGTTPTASGLAAPAPEASDATTQAAVGGDAAPGVAATAAQSGPFERGVEIRTGTIRRTKQFSVRVGGGQLGIQLSLHAIKGCSVTLLVPDGAVVALPGEVGMLQLSTTVKTGRYVVDVDCPTLRPKPYVLSLTGMFPAGPRGGGPR